MVAGWIILIVIVVFVLASLGKGRQQAVITSQKYDLRPCGRCGAANPGHSVFCGKCGTKLTLPV